METSAPCRSVDYALPVKQEVNKHVDISWRSLAQCSSKEARKLIPYALANRHLLLPLSLSSRSEYQTLLIAAPAKLDDEVVRSLRFVSGVDLVFDYLDSRLLERAIDVAYLADNSSCQMASALAQNDVCSKELPATYSAAIISKAPVPKLLETILNRAILQSATDIHIEPSGDAACLRFRIDGILRPEPSFNVTSAVKEQLLRRIQVLASLDTTARNEPQEGGFSFTCSGEEVRLRVSLLPAFNGVKAVLRILDNHFWKDIQKQCSHMNLLSALGLDDSQRRVISAGIARGSGTILTVGPTGSGKSTLLYALLSLLNDSTRNIVTIEDPVERTIPGASQIDLGNLKQHGYGAMLKAAMRQDPDVVMIGEIRDSETAHTALTAGITGHVVLSSLHSGNCIEAVERLEQLGVSARLISSAVTLFIAQRLLPKNCGHCAVPFENSKELCRRVGLSKQFQFLHSPGCEACGFRGTDGQAAIFEIMPMTSRLRCYLASARSAMVFKELHHGPLFSAQALELMVAGNVSPVYALRALGVNIKE